MKNTCRHNPLEIFLMLPPLSWLVLRYIDFSVDREFKTMKAKGYEPYLGYRYDKNNKIIASGVVCWRKIK